MMKFRQVSILRVLDQRPLHGAHAQAVIQGSQDGPVVCEIAEKLQQVLTIHLFGIGLGRRPMLVDQRIRILVDRLGLAPHAASGRREEFVELPKRVREPAIDHVLSKVEGCTKGHGLFKIRSIRGEGTEVVVEGKDAKCRKGEAAWILTSMGRSNAFILGLTESGCLGG